MTCLFHKIKYIRCVAWGRLILCRTRRFKIFGLFVMLCNVMLEHCALYCVVVFGLLLLHGLDKSLCGHRWANLILLFSKSAKTDSNQQHVHSSWSLNFNSGPLRYYQMWKRKRELHNFVTISHFLLFYK